MCAQTWQTTRLPAIVEQIDLSVRCTLEGMPGGGSQKLANQWPIEHGAAPALLSDLPVRLRWAVQGKPLWRRALEWMRLTTPLGPLEVDERLTSLYATFARVAVRFMAKLLYIGRTGEGYPADALQFGAPSWACAVNLHNYAILAHQHRGSTRPYHDPRWRVTPPTGSVWRTGDMLFCAGLLDAYVARLLQGSPLADPIMTRRLWQQAADRMHTDRDWPTRGRSRHPRREAHLDLLFDLAATSPLTPLLYANVQDLGSRATSTHVRQLAALEGADSLVERTCQLWVGALCADSGTWPVRQRLHHLFGLHRSLALSSAATDQQRYAFYSHAVLWCALITALHRRWQSEDPEAFLQCFGSEQRSEAGVVCNPFGFVTEYGRLRQAQEDGRPLGPAEQRFAQCIAEFIDSRAWEWAAEVYERAVPMEADESVAVEVHESTAAT